MTDTSESLGPWHGGRDNEPVASGPPVGGHGEVLLYNSRGPVWLEAGGDAVRKEYDYGDLATSRHQAAQEFDRLTRFEQALRPLAGIRCPRPLSTSDGGDGALPTVRMERCSGEELAFFLVRPEVTNETRRSIAQRMATAVRIYVDTFAEPYIDCSFHNALYDAETDMLTLLDFGPWGLPRRQRRLNGPLESSLGSIIGMATRSQLGVSRPPPWRDRVRVIRAAASVVSFAEQSQDRRDLKRHELRRRAWSTYRTYTYRGSVARQIWYRTGAAVIASFIFRGYRWIAL